jgi:hypothetical protein
MGKNPASYKFEKRKKEIARQKKQEEKRQRQLEKKQEKPNDPPLISPDGIPITPLEEIDADLHIDDIDDPLV